MIYWWTKIRYSYSTARGNHGLVVYLQVLGPIYGVLNIRGMGWDYRNSSNLANSEDVEIIGCDTKWYQISMWFYIQPSVHRNNMSMFSIPSVWSNMEYDGDIAGVIEGSLEVKLPTIWTDGKAELGRVREKKSIREKIREEKEWEERRCRCAKM